jgi:hypothetical protein
MGAEAEITVAPEAVADAESVMGAEPVEAAKRTKVSARRRRAGIVGRGKKK